MALLEEAHTPPEDHPALRPRGKEKEKIDFADRIVLYPDQNTAPQLSGICTPLSFA
jgi:hypothetical protein